MYRLTKRKFYSREEAKAYLEQKGKLEYFGVVGDRGEKYVYNLTTPDGRLHRMLVHEDGNIEIKIEAIR